MKDIFRIIAMALLIVLVMDSASGAISQNELSENVVRLHVLAASDSEEDQQQKLRVRDAVLEELSQIVNSDMSRSEAAEAISQSSALIQAAAETEAENVELKFGSEYYPERRYGDTVFPAGEYLSLRVLIDGGEGKNWWCVVYPPLCLELAEGSESVTTADFGQDFEAYSADGFQIRFKLLDIVAKIKNLLW